MSKNNLLYFFITSAVTAL